MCPNNENGIANSVDPDQTAPLGPTIMILSFWIDKPGQTVQTQIRLLLEQSDQGLHCLPFRLHRLDSLLYGRAILFKFLSDYNKYFGCPNI